ncbi:MAG: hypothetical protein BWY69_00485 [Planctomycetes bacterium ADurb.Bin401]|nr:MAG: hypothetical protein BWY69_00485 [Planctomycetes bacterium ADurb.Bin401]
MTGISLYPEVSNKMSSRVLSLLNIFCDNTFTVSGDTTANSSSDVGPFDRFGGLIGYPRAGIKMKPGLLLVI